LNQQEQLLFLHEVAQDEESKRNFVRAMRFYNEVLSGAKTREEQKMTKPEERTKLLEKMRKQYNTFMRERNKKRALGISP